MGATYPAELAEVRRRCPDAPILLPGIGAQAGDLRWLGFLRSEEALARVSGSLAGLSLLNDLPNYRVSLPTKIVEYCVLGVPVITTPLPLASDLA